MTETNPTAFQAEVLFLRGLLTDLAATIDPLLPESASTIRFILASRMALDV